MLTWEKTHCRGRLAASKTQAFRKTEGKQFLQGSRVVWLLLGCIDTLQRDIEKQRALNKQLKAKYQSQIASLIAYKEVRASLQK